jgi:hypothetical protein
MYVIFKRLFPASENILYLLCKDKPFVALLGKRASVSSENNKKFHRYTRASQKLSAM